MESWRNRKTLILSRAAGSLSAAADKTVLLSAQARKPLRREPRSRRVGELPHDFL